MQPLVPSVGITATTTVLLQMHLAPLQIKPITRPAPLGPPPIHKVRVRRTPSDSHHNPTTRAVPLDSQARSARRRTRLPQPKGRARALATLFRRTLEHLGASATSRTKLAVRLASPAMPMPHPMHLLPTKQRKRWTVVPKLTHTRLIVPGNTHPSRVMQTSM